MRVGKIGVVIIGLVPCNVYGECTPTPDCADMGYTETSCSGKFVRCPFDTSKLFCAPCDSVYQYACDGEGQIGKGTPCNGQYIQCACSEGYELSNGNCIISCAYTATNLPTGCSTADSCTKNGATYYSSTCTTCQNGYSLSSGKCSANVCSGYYSSKTGCSIYSTCLSGTTTKYNCTNCNSGYTASSGQCKANSCSGYASSVPSNCSSYNTCKTPTSTKYKCTACKSGYTVYSSENTCIDNYCYSVYEEWVTKANADYGVRLITSEIECYGTPCTGNDGKQYCYTGWGI